MLIEFIKKPNFYDDIETRLYGTEYNDKIIYNFIPVKILNEYYILTSLKNLEGYLMDYRENIEVNLYLNNENYIININSVISFQEIKYDPSKQYDCYIDSICNLLLIRFKSNKLKYINIDNTLNIEKDICYHENLTKLTYRWTNNYLKEVSYSKKTIVKYTWDEKYVNLPPIPYLIDIPFINGKLLPCSGSGVFEDDELIGMVSYVNNFEILITPLICLKKLSKYLEGEFILTLGLETQIVNFNFKSELNQIDYTNGLIILNNFYANTLSRKNKIKEK